MTDRLAKLYGHLASALSSPKEGLLKSHVQDKAATFAGELAANGPTRGEGALLADVFTKAAECDRHTRLRILVQMCDRAIIRTDGRSNPVVRMLKNGLENAVLEKSDMSAADTQKMAAQLLTRVATTDYCKEVLKSAFHLDDGRPTVGGRSTTTPEPEQKDGPRVVYKKIRRVVIPPQETGPA